MFKSWQDIFAMLLLLLLVIAAAEQVWDMLLPYIHNTLL